MGGEERNREEGEKGGRKEGKRERERKRERQRRVRALMLECALVLAECMKD